MGIWFNLLYHLVYAGVVRGFAGGFCRDRVFAQSGSVCAGGGGVCRWRTHADIQLPWRCNPGQFDFFRFCKHMVAGTAWRTVLWFTFADRRQACC